MTRKERESYWHRIIDQESTSSQSTAAFCRKHKIDQGSFYRWRRRLSQNNQNGFLELQAPTPNPNAPNAGLRIRVKESIFIEVEPDFDPSTLRAVVDVLAS